MMNAEGFNLDEVNSLVGAIVGWLGIQAAAGVQSVTVDTIRAEFSDGTPLGADTLEEAISAIEHSAKMIVYPI